MNSIKFTDWQEMALKKDTEAIIKKLNAQEPVFLSLCWEIVLAIGVIIVDHLFDGENINIAVWITCVIIAVTPPVVIIVIKFARWLSSLRNARNGKYNVRRFVDCFDNQICYCVMMCNSYSRILASLPEDALTDRVFIYQEGCYYNNKSIHLLYQMKPVIDKVFSAHPCEVIGKNIIDLYRLSAILEMMAVNQRLLQKSISDIRSNPYIATQIEINESFSEKIEAFIADINQQFSITLQWPQ